MIEMKWTNETYLQHAKWCLGENAKPGIKFCLKDKNTQCFEQCYDDREFCETVVYLGYPEEKIKYPNAYPISLIINNDHLISDSDDDNDWLEIGSDNDYIFMPDENFKPSFDFIAIDDEIDFITGE